MSTIIQGVPELSGSLLAINSLGRSNQILQYEHGPQVNIFGSNGCMYSIYIIKFKNSNIVFIREMKCCRHTCVMCVMKNVGG